MLEIPDSLDVILLGSTTPQLLVWLWAGEWAWISQSFSPQNILRPSVEVDMPKYKIMDVNQCELASPQAHTQAYTCITYISLSLSLSPSPPTPHLSLRRHLQESSQRVKASQTQWPEEAVQPANVVARDPGD